MSTYIIHKIISIQTNLPITIRIAVTTLINFLWLSKLICINCYLKTSQRLGNLLILPYYSFCNIHQLHVCVNILSYTHRMFYPAYKQKVCLLFKVVV